MHGLVSGARDGVVSKRVVLVDVPRYHNRNEDTPNRTTDPKNQNEGTFDKPALLFPLDCNRQLVGRPRQENQRMSEKYRKMSPNPFEHKFSDICAYLITAFAWHLCPMHARYKHGGPIARLLSASHSI